MPVELKVPSAGESVTEVRIGAWLKEEGDHVEKDETIVELDSDKAALEVPAPTSGTLSKILLQVGDDAAPGDVLAYIDDGDADAGQTQAKRPSDKASKMKRPEDSSDTVSEESRSRGPEKVEVPANEKKGSGEEDASDQEEEHEDEVTESNEMKENSSKSTGSEGRSAAERDQPEDKAQRSKANSDTSVPPDSDEEIVPMTLLRQRIAENLVRATQQMALLTTVNEVDLSTVIALRKRHKERFQESYGTGLGFMSFFVKAVIEGLKQFPPINAEIRGTDIVFRNHYDIGIAIGSKRGLVVPVLRQADRKSFAEIESAIRDFADRAERNKLRPQELAGGTFTITNGGVYGSLLSTPIVNPPQSAILGMHSIVDRPIAVEGQVVVRPMMYIALTYDHRLIDGREAVQFLVRVKELIEDPARMLLEV